MQVILNSLTIKLIKLYYQDLKILLKILLLE